MGAVTHIKEETIMGFSVNTNVSALQAYNNLNNTQNKLQTSLSRLSSGYRINNAGDDAAGLSISEGLQAQISGNQVASRNAQDGISLLQTTDGALTQVQSILHRVRDLAVQAANDSNNDDSRTAIQTEVTQLASELTRMGGDTNFNGIKLLDGSGTALTFQVGAGSDPASDQVVVDLSGANVNAVGTAIAGLTFNSAANASASIAAVDAQIKSVSTAQATIGATENRFADAVQTLAVTGQNLSAANSRIQDTDMASEMVNYSQQSILQQAGVSMLAQANASSQGILKLLG
ncbi:flagellin [Gryllotalpicola daejeonensis]|uniref:Flagellin n=2 Tax=Gryllotalpicola daejeonensis TaxID=993087 RepID=A0ABP7ZHS5_9MICO